jgi:hypothetical protein
MTMSHSDVSGSYRVLKRAVFCRSPSRHDVEGTGCANNAKIGDRSLKVVPADLDKEVFSAAVLIRSLCSG